MSKEYAPTIAFKADDFRIVPLLEPRLRLLNKEDADNLQKVVGEHYARVANARLKEMLNILDSLIEEIKASTCGPDGKWGYQCLDIVRKAERELDKILSRPECVCHETSWRNCPKHNAEGFAALGRE